MSNEIEASYPPLPPFQPSIARIHDFEASEDFSSESISSNQSEDQSDSESTDSDLADAPKRSKSVSISIKNTSSTIKNPSLNVKNSQSQRKRKEHKRGQKSRTTALRKRIVGDIIAGVITQQEAAKIHGVTKGAISHWVKKHRENYSEISTSECILHRSRHEKYPKINAAILKLIYHRLQCYSKTGIGLSWSVIKGKIRISQYIYKARSK